MPSLTLLATPTPFSSFLYPLPSTQQCNLSPRTAARALRIPKPPTCSLLSPRPYKTPPPSPLQSSSLQFFTPFPGLISSCRPCLGKQPQGFNRLFSDFWQTCLWRPAASYEKGLHQDRKHKDIADTHTFWVADVLVVSIDTTTNRVDLCRHPHISLRPYSTLHFICLLPLTYSSRRPPYLTYQREQLPP